MCLPHGFLSRPLKYKYEKGQNGVDFPTSVWAKAVLQALCSCRACTMHLAALLACLGHLCIAVTTSELVMYGAGYGAIVGHLFLASTPKDNVKSPPSNYDQFINLRLKGHYCDYALLLLAMVNKPCVVVTGAEGSEGKLTRAEEKAMREYVPQLTLLKKEEAQQQVLQWLHHNVVQTAAGCSSTQRPTEVDVVV